jgi:DNA-directed RNA polymerase subunit M/transcription elongation factor TFIIS
MKFCYKCDNMYYIKISDTKDDSLSYYCRVCGNEETSHSEEPCVLSTINNTTGEQIYNYLMIQSMIGIYFQQECQIQLMFCLLKMILVDVFK